MEITTMSRVFRASIAMLITLTFVPVVAQQETESVQAARARLQASASLESSDLPAIRAGIQRALSDRFVISTLEKPLEHYEGGVEVQMDQQGRIRFRRVRHRDPLVPDVSISLTEVTDLPAVLCRDRSRRDGKLALAFNYWRGTWQNVHAKIHMATHELDMLLDLPAERMTDYGPQTVRSRRTRGIRFRMAPEVAHTFWIDLATLLPVRYSMLASFEGRSHEVFTMFDYPVGQTIERPSGLTIPDCI
jgi:hypothetical protein